MARGAMCMYVCRYVCMYVCMYVRMHSTYIYIYTYTHMRIYIYIYICIYTHTTGMCRNVKIQLGPKVSGRMSFARFLLLVLIFTEG